MLKRNLAANFLGQAWTAIIGIAFVPIYVRYLGIESYGLIGLFAILQTWLTLLDIGMSPTLSREMARYVAGEHTPATIRDLLRSIELIALAVAVIMAAGIWISASWLSTHWLRPSGLPPATIGTALQLMGIVAATRFVEGIYRSGINGMQRQVTLNIWTAIATTVRNVGAVVIVIFVSRTIEAFFIWQAVVSFVTAVALMMLTHLSLPRINRRPRFSITALRQVSGFASGLVGITLLSLLLTQIDKLILSRTLGLREFGYYTLANVVAAAIFMLIQPICTALSPRMTELVARRADAALAEVYHLGTQLVVVCAGSVALTLAVFSREILQLWTGDAALATAVAPLLLPLVIGNLLNGFMNLPHYLQMAYGWTGLIIRTNLIALLVVAPTLIWVTPRYGAVGAAWVWVALNFGYFTISVQFMHRRILCSELGHWYVRDVGLPMLAGCTGLFLVKALTPAGTGAFGNLIAIGCGAVLAVLGTAASASRVRITVLDAVTSRTWPTLRTIRTRGRVKR